jgi:hypothetical protein
MTTEKFFTVTLNAKKVKRACELFVANTLGDSAMDHMTFEAKIDGLENVDVVIRKKQKRKPRAEAA